MIIFDCTDALGNKIPDGCKDCPFVDNNLYKDEYWSDERQWDYYCSLTRDEIGRFNYGGLDQLTTYLKLTSCPLKEVEE